MRFSVLFRKCGLFILIVVTSVTQKRKNIQTKEGGLRMNLSHIATRKAGESNRCKTQK